VDLHRFDANQDPESGSDRHQHGYSDPDLHRQCRSTTLPVAYNLIEVGERYLFFALEDWAIR
jgi:hypothetical protein